MADGIRKNKPTFLDAMNKVRKDKGKPILAGKPLRKAGPKTIERLARRADKGRKR